MGKGGGGANIDNADRHAYLQLSVTILASFARLPELAATDEMLSKIPLVLELMPNQYVIYCYFLIFLFHLVSLLISYFLNAINYHLSLSLPFGI